MFDFLDQVREHLQESNVFPGIVKLSGQLEPTPSAVTIRPTPTRAGTRYFEGSNELVSFQIIVKDPDQVTAMKRIEAISKKCRSLTRNEITNLIDCDVYSSPSFVEKTSKNEYIYSALFQAELEEV